MHNTPRGQLSISGLSFRYPPIQSEAAPDVFRSLSLSLSPGSTTVILGAADAGKTTLARILAGAVPRFSGGTLEGSISLGNLDVRASLPWQLMEHVGMVSQNSEEQIFTTRCDTEVAFALESLGVPRAEMVERVEESLQLVNLAAKRAQNPSSLSGGEKKRLLVACLAAIGPQVWILDEALPELDRAWRARILDFLKAQGRTVLLLDSRLTQLHAERGNEFGVFSAGGIAGPCDDPHADAIHAPALAEGILPGATLDIGRRPARTNFVRCSGIDFQFPDSGEFALSIPSLELEAGGVCSLLGHNGSGKSTLGRILCGLLPPRSGTISLWDGSAYRDARARELNERVGYLFQNPDHQIFLPTVSEELALGLRRRGVPEEEIRRRVEQACRLFLLPDPGALPSLMSFGARRRLQAATCYLLKRDFLILDEVDTGLSYRDLETLLRELFEQAAGILLITHDAALAADVSDRVLLMSSGRITADLRRGELDRLDTLLDEDESRVSTNDR